ncbi:MAG: hypothetical protein M5U34_27815 [Chloroflexi bacterium]|nr:hypothetical protein [Chloroflexota bacterium]
MDQIDPVVIKGLRVPRRLAELFEDGISIEHVHGWTEPDLRKWREREYTHNESVRVVHVESDAYPPNVIVDMPYVENAPAPLRQWQACILVKKTKENFNKGSLIGLSFYLVRPTWAVTRE